TSSAEVLQHSNPRRSSPRKNPLTLSTGDRFSTRTDLHGERDSRHGTESHREGKEGHHSDTPTMLMVTLYADVSREKRCSNQREMAPPLSLGCRGLNTSAERAT
ncbi:hypothetical protein HPB47_017194, partial [Ixodes persulcatus]